jgi:CheY-like chemotaxis protein
VILASLDEGHLNVSARIIMSSQPDMEMVAQAGNAEQAIAEFQLALMDLSLPGTNGTDTLIAIRAEFPNAQIIMLTMSEGDGDAGAGRIVADSRWPSNKQIADDLGIAEDHRELLHQEPAVRAFADELYDAPRSWAEQRIPSSFTTTGSRRAATSPPGSSRSSSAKRFARASDRR